MSFKTSDKKIYLKKVEKLYRKQNETGTIRRANCNFLELEKAMLERE